MTTTTTEHGERLAKLEGAYDHLATKDDVSKATLKTVIWIVGVGIASLATILSVQINILSRLPN